MAADDLVTVRDLTVVLGKQTVLDNLTFSVPAGKTTAIIGPNGAGKSVLLKALLGLLPITAGSVTILGVDRAHYRSVARSVSYVPQRLTLNPQFPLTVAGLFALASPRLVGVTDQEKKRMHELLALVGMKDTAEAALATLSGGQLQRVLIAFSLLKRPKLLILDEPVAGIDAQGQETVYALLERISRQESLTLLLVSHELDVVMQYADQVLCLNRRLLCAGLPHEVLSQEVLSEMYGAPMRHFHHDHDSR